MPRPLWGTTWGVLTVPTRVLTVVQYGANMVRIRPLKTKLGIETEKYWEGLVENFFFCWEARNSSIVQDQVCCAKAVSNICKKPLFWTQEENLQDQNDLAPVFLGNRFAYKICIRDFRAIRSFDLWSFFCSIRYREYLHSTRRFFLQLVDSRPL